MDIVEENLDRTYLQTMPEEFYGNVVKVIQGTAEPIVKMMRFYESFALLKEYSSRQKRMKLLKDLKPRL